MKHFISGKIIACDTETTGLNTWLGDQPFAFSFTNEKMESAYFEWDVNPYTRKVIVSKPELEVLRAFFLDESITKVFHHIKFDQRMLEAIGITIRGPIHDTMYMMHILNNLEPKFGLKVLASKYFEYPLVDRENLRRTVISLRRKAKVLRWKIHDVWEPDCWLPRAMCKFYPDLISRMERNRCKKYAVNDSERTMMLFLMAYPLLKVEAVLHTYEEEMGLHHVTYDMETRGVAISKKRLRRVTNKSIVKVEECIPIVVNKAKRLGINPFKFDVPAHMRKLFFDSMELKVTEFTPKTRQPKIGIEVLRPHKNNPIVKAWGEGRAHIKALNTYFHNYAKLLVPDHIINGGSCIHTTFNQIGPVTGRFSSNTPNLQNASTEKNTPAMYPIEMRSPFGPRKGYIWYMFDYKQLEVIIFVDVSGETSMKQAILSGGDFHSFTANKAWGGRTKSALQAALHALELDGSGEHDNLEVRKVWRENGIRKRHESELKSTGKMERLIARMWLKSFDYDIVLAENSLGKSQVRKRAKAILFARIFGGGPKAVMTWLNCDYVQARNFLYSFNKPFPRIDKYMAELIKLSLDKGYIRTAYNRLLRINPKFAYRSVNYMVQGSAAGLLKRAMSKVAAYLAEHNCGYIVLTVHDELVVEMKKPVKLSDIRNIALLMSDNEGVFSLSTPVQVERCIKSWNESVPVTKLGNDGLVTYKT